MSKTQILIDRYYREATPGEVRCPCCAHSKPFCQPSGRSGLICRAASTKGGGSAIVGARMTCDIAMGVEGKK